MHDLPVFQHEGLCTSCIKDLYTHYMLPCPALELKQNRHGLREKADPARIGTMPCAMHDRANLGPAQHCHGRLHWRISTLGKYLQQCHCASHSRHQPPSKKNSSGIPPNTRLQPTNGAPCIPALSTPSLLVHSVSCQQ